MKRMMNNITDSAERERALAIDTSFIVRAPAGAGKTRLLIQRYLALLAIVDAPEEIIAITFTRKAAAEMRQRVMNALMAATDENIHEDSQTRALAKRVIARDVGDDAWRLTENQSRLRIQTIDALNASLTRQMPMLARFGAQPESVDDAGSLYLEAATNLLAELDADNAVADDIATLLTHLDNNLSIATQLLADMLKARDHWLRNLSDMQVRDALEATLKVVSVDALRYVSTLYPVELKNETLALAGYSGQNLLKAAADISDLNSTKHAALKVCVHRHDFPSAQFDDLSAWLAIADLLLTASGEWRKPKGINKNIGFPVGETTQEKKQCKEMKARIQALLDDISQRESSQALMAALAALRALPAATYADEEWQVLGAIVRLLPHATAHLWTVFGQHGQCDFTEISQAAARALGADDAPTDLALSLDYRIRHLLIDEFQDTSHAQFSLLEKLTRGWMPDDGRSLFVVGDPMQSIYRFREAEVSLFLRAREFGIGSVSLTPLTLSVNFRSQPTVVAWVNDTFQPLMPADSQRHNVGVPYSKSSAFQTASETNHLAVQWHWTFDDKAEEPDTATTIVEANTVVNIIRGAQVNKPEGSIAILVRNRTHLADIIPALKNADIHFQAVDIDPLKNRPIVEDLFALTRAISHLADRIAWLSVLRAPWCGLTLNDLAELTNSAAPINDAITPDARTIWEMLHDHQRIATLSDDGQARLIACRDVLEDSVGSPQHTSLRDTVENTWLRLKGPACLESQAALADAQTFLDLLETCSVDETGGSQICDFQYLESRVDRLFSGNQRMGESDTPAVTIMTIHKAKGLEFDTVIVPGLQRTPRMNSKKLLAWSDDMNVETGERELLLAPIRETGVEENADSIYTYIAKRERDKQQQEDVRLMYVAATRAVANLHLLATLQIHHTDEDTEIVPPKSASLLASIWPSVAAIVAIAADKKNAPRETNVVVTPPLIEAPRYAIRLAKNTPWPAMPETIMHHDITLIATDAQSQTTIDFDWASDTARHIGTIVHALLQTIAEDGLDKWSRERISQTRAKFSQTLLSLGVAANQVEDAVTRICLALENTLADKCGRWILSPHIEARAEWRLTGFNDNKLINIIIDRSFVDEDGTRWIIDFKTGDHQGTDVDAFLDNEVKRYSAQLDTYAKLVSAMSQKTQPIKCGLYFPLLGGWREWVYA
jgi:ATP-dependent helicase/nuclease subunit A